MTDPTELRRLAEAATPGPWRTSKADDTAIMSFDNDVAHTVGIYEVEAETMEADAAYIAAANPAAILALLDRLARVETLVAQCKATLEAMPPATGMPDGDVARLCNAMMEALGDEQ